ncbi:MAG: hypothetical protein WCQ53_03435 [bacterium]
MTTKETVTVSSPSFPDVPKNLVMGTDTGKLWQVICGDKDHWRVGIYSPDAVSLDAVDRFEKHSCPEFFLLLSGEISLLLINNGEIEIITLEPLKPILVDTWHGAYCPCGKNTGTALVVERDAFTTEYKSIKQLTKASNPCL